MNSDYINFAIYENNNGGFNFGNTFYMDNQFVYFNYTGYYENNGVVPSMNINFIPEEIEVFKVVTVDPLYSQPLYSHILYSQQ